ncbi:hypothetical protein B4U80_13143 [Leptotrombidium deliense]|uniref:F-box domain-containing protein n=1 Tax=Leptotrombidium deliense TaxID=299467 RepID=A0A443SBY6_9ACAR|nr:hypothetical protein B4U80_13143 [Leptotrombidium deliense]
MFNDLPLDIKLNIFSYLTLKERIGVQRVGKQWLQLSKQSMVDIRTLVLFGDLKFNENRIYALSLLEKGAIYVQNWYQMELVLQLCTNAKSIFIYGWWEWTMASQMELKEYASKVEVFYSECRCISKFSPNIRRNGPLHVVMGSLGYLNLPAFDYESQVSVVHSWCTSGRLKCDWLFDDFLCLLLRKECKLNTLIFHAPIMKLDGIQLPLLKKLEFRIDCINMSDVLMEVSLKSAKTLEELKITSADEVCLSIISNFENLKDLRITCTSKVILGNWSEYFRFTKLEVLSIHVEEIDLTQLVPVVLRNPLLKVLDLNSLRTPLKANVIKQICDNCKNLKSLLLNNQQKVSDETFLHLLELPKLEMLCLQSACDSDINFYVDNVCQFIRTAPSLRVIETISNMDILKAMTERAVEKPHQTYFCNFRYKYSPELYPRNLFTYYPNSPYTEKDIRKFPSCHYLDYFDWKRIPIRKDDKSPVDVEMFFNLYGNL